MFQPGQFYSRRQINTQVGGDLISYLPSAKGRIVAACLRLDTNPDAPRVILPGTGVGIEAAARFLVGQRSAVPTFLWRGPYRWEYVGDHVAERWSHDADDIAFQQRRSGRSLAGRNRIASVIYMASRPATESGLS